MIVDFLYPIINDTLEKTIEAQKIPFSIKKVQKYLCELPENAKKMPKNWLDLFTFCLKCGILIII